MLPSRSSRRLAGVILASWPLMAIAFVRADQGDARASAVAQVAATGEIRGRVLANDTGAPVRQASVRLVVTAMGSGPVRSGTWFATTDPDGRFVIGELPAGRATLEVSKAGFVTTTFGQLVASPARGAVPIALAAGARIDRGDLRLPRGGVITGRVYDDFGEPMSEVTVTAIRVEYPQPGVRRAVRERTIGTNDLGEFRLYGLRPGAYYVAATMGQPRVSVANGNTAADQFAATSRAMASTYFPGAGDAASAEAVRVVAGSATGGVDIRLLSTPLARLSGRIVDSAGQPAGAVVAMLNAARADDLVPPLVAEVDASGRFSFVNVPPGAYRIDVESAEALGRVAASGRVEGRSQSADAPEFASVPVVVDGRDIDGLFVATSRGFSVSGRVTVAGATVTAAQMAGMTVHVLPIITGQSMTAILQMASANVRPDGSFDVRGVAGPRVVSVSGLPAGWALERVRAFGADVTDLGFEANGADVVGVEVTVTPAPIYLAGQAVDARGETASGASVIVFSEDSRLWTVPRSRHVALGRVDASGAFRIGPLPAGRYFVAALADLNSADWADPRELARLQGAATMTTLMAGENQPVRLLAMGAAP